MERFSTKNSEFGIGIFLRIVAAVSADMVPPNAWLLVAHASGVAAPTTYNKWLREKCFTKGLDQVFMKLNRFTAY